MQLTLEDSRRLTGPNLFWERPGAIIDVFISGLPAAQVIEIWQAQIRSFLDAVGWNREQARSRIYLDGASLVISAPIDVLYAATEVNEAAWAATAGQLGGPAAPPFNAEVARLKSVIAEESKPSLLALQQAAVDHRVRFLWDDDEVSIGYGPACRRWPMAELPNPDAVDWPDSASIPLALITGTNGKSTSVRLAAAVMSAAGKTCGITSTDYIRVGERILDSGDYSGPGGARTLLRDPRVDVALLEVARGGLLRRGLGVTEADAVLITNVAADHLGEYGINTVPELIEAKFIVRRALKPDQPLILNADDAGIVDYACSLDQRIVWFSERPDNPVLDAHREIGGEAATLKDGHIIWHRGDDERVLMPVSDAPITLGGAARHNVQNVLGVVALAKVLAIPEPAIVAGLKDFGGTPEENPGRGNLFDANGVRVLVDFAHNEHGLSAMAQTVAGMDAQRRLVLMGQAGDRSDELIADLVRAAMQARPDCLVICELPGYERGRRPDEVPALIRQLALEAGMNEDQIIHATGPAEGTQKALDWAQPGDFLLLLTLTEREQAIDIIRQRANG